MLAITVTAPMPLTDAAVSAFTARGTGTEFSDVAGLPASNLPQDWVMSTEDLVDAALAGLDRGEFTTVPSLQDASERDAWEAAREIMLPPAVECHACRALLRVEVIGCERTSPFAGPEQSPG